MALHKTDVASDEIKALEAALRAALARDFNTEAFPSEGWALKSVELRSFLGVAACAVFSREGREVYVIVRPTDPESENAYFRTARNDMAYFFEDVTEEERQSAWQNSRGLIDGFAGWLDAWDTAQADAQ